LCDDFLFVNFYVLFKLENQMMRGL